MDVSIDEMNLFCVLQYSLCSQVLRLFLSAFDVSIVSSDGQLNLAARGSASAWQFGIFPLPSALPSLLVTPFSFLNRGFSSSVTSICGMSFDIEASGQTRGRQFAEASEVRDLASLVRVHVRYLLQLLARGFGARLRLIRPLLLPLGSWDMEVVLSSSLFS